MNVSKIITNNPTIEKTFLGMLLQLGEATSLDVKMAVRTLDPDGKYFQQQVSDELQNISERLNIPYYNKVAPNGEFYRWYFLETNIKPDLEQKLFLGRIPDFSKKGVDKTLGLLSADKDIYDPLDTISPPKVFYTYVCGTSGANDEQTILAESRNKARNLFSQLRDVPYTIVYAKKLK